MKSPELIRTWTNGRFRLELFDTHKRDWRGQTRMAYQLSDAGKLIFEGADFAGSPLHADDSDATVGALLSFLSLRPRDTDAEHFEPYTPEQLDWCQANGEELALEASQLEGRGFVACSEDFPRLWNDPKTSHRDRKRMVRLLVEDVILKPHILAIICVGCITVISDLWRQLAGF